MSECPGLRPAWPHLCVRTAWCLSFFVSSSSPQLSFSVLVRTAGCLSPSHHLRLSRQAVTLGSSSLLLLFIVSCCSSCLCEVGKTALVDDATSPSPRPPDLKMSQRQVVAQPGSFKQSVNLTSSSLQLFGSCPLRPKCHTGKWWPNPVR